MKPKNKFQQQVEEVSKTLPTITKEQIQWGYDNVDCVKTVHFNEFGIYGRRKLYFYATTT